MTRWMIAMAMIVCQKLKAQTFSEWFFQNKTQIRYLHKQIAALAIFIRDLDLGYSLVQAGTGLIGGLQQDDQDQHRAYFASLKTVKPDVGSNAWVSSIREQAARIETAGMACLKTAQGSQWLTMDEKDFIQKCITIALGKISDQMKLLDQLLAPGAWELSDAERLDRIDDIGLTMGNLLLFIVTYRNLMDEVISARSSGLKDARNLMLFYGKKTGS